MRAMIVAQKHAEVSKINMEKELIEKLAFQRGQTIEGTHYFLPFLIAVSSS
jgi:hypothetical protein